MRLGAIITCPWGIHSWFAVVKYIERQKRTRTGSKISFLFPENIFVCKKNAETNLQLGNLVRALLEERFWVQMKLI